MFDLEREILEKTIRLNDNKPIVHIASILGISRSTFSRKLDLNNNSPDILLVGSSRNEHDLGIAEGLAADTGEDFIQRFAEYDERRAASIEGLARIIILNEIGNARNIVNIRADIALAGRAVCESQMQGATDEVVAKYLGISPGEYREYSNIVPGENFGKSLLPEHAVSILDDDGNVLPFWAAESVALCAVVESYEGNVIIAAEDLRYSANDVEVAIGRRAQQLSIQTNG